MSVLLMLWTSVFAAQHPILDRPEGNFSWVSFWAMTPETYQKRLDDYKKLGYRPVDVEIRSGSARRYALIMRRDTTNRGWVIKTQLDHNQFNQKWTELKNKGYRIVDQESYRHKNKNFYAGIWIKNTENYGWASIRNYSASDFQKYHQQQTAKGRVITDVNVYEQAGKLKYSGIWVENRTRLQSRYFSNVSASSFGAHYKSQTRAGWKMYDHNSIRYKGKQFFSVIWVKDGRRTLARRDMDASSFQNWFNKFRDMGYRLVDVEEYKLGSKTRYAGVWVENDSTRVTFSKRAQLERLVKAELGRDPAKGMSVVLMRRGKRLYQGGFGMQGDKREAHAKTLYRLASVSKAVSGVMGFRLQEQNQLDLGRSIRTYLPGLPVHHTYDVGELLTNRSMVRHYKDNDPVRRLGQVTWAWPAVRSFMRDSLRSGSYLYSTHGYTVFAAAVEAKTKRSFCLELERLTRAANPRVNSLRCENRTVSNANRSTLYSANSEGKLSKTSADNLSWKFAGGGMESNAIDLARFGSNLERGGYITRRSRETMTTRPDSARNYAFGWDVGSRTASGVRRDFYAKAGDQRGGRAYLLVYPSEDVVVSVMANTRGQTTGYRTLAHRIAELLF